MNGAEPMGHIDSSGGSAVVRGSDIKVSQIALECEHAGMSPDEIVEAHPDLTLAQVHAALAYYYDNQEEIRAAWKAADALIARLRVEYPPRERKARAPH